MRPIIGLLLWAGLTCSFAQEREKELEEMNREEFEREYFAPRRAGTADYVAARLKAWRQITAMEKRKGRAAVVPVNGAWREIGPRTIRRSAPSGPVSGRITAIVVDPRDANRMYLGTANAGVWLTENGGTSWRNTTDQLPFFAIGAITLDPRNPDIVYIGLGDSEGNLGIGMYRSEDRGQTWQEFPGPVGDRPVRYRSLVVHPETGDIYACLPRVGLNSSDLRSAGLYRYSASTGEWKALLVGGISDRLLIHPTNRRILYATLATYNARSGIYKSVDGGETWTRMVGSGSNAITETNQASRYELALAPSAPDTLYVAVAPGQTSFLYKSTDGAVNWQKISPIPNYCGQQCAYNNLIVVHPTQPDTFFLAGVWLYRTTDGGRTLANILEQGQVAAYGGAYVDYHAMVLAPDANRLWVGNDGGIFVLNSPMAPLTPNTMFASLNNNLGLMLARARVETAPDDLNFALVGTQDLLTQRYTGSQLWDMGVIRYVGGVGCGDGGHPAIDPSNSSVAYLTCFNRFLMRSTDKGLTWANGRANIDANDRVSGNPPILFDPANSRRIFYGTYRVWLSTDGGTSFTAVSGDLSPPNPNEPTSAIHDLRVSGNTVYAATTKGEVWVCVNPAPGAQWRSISPSGWPRSPTTIASDPRDPKHVAIQVTGIYARRVVETFDGGETWDDITGNLPLINMESISMDPDSPGTIYTGSDLGAFATRGGHFWDTIGDGLPRTPVTSIAIHRASRTLRAGTYGRGVWDLSVPRPGVCEYSVDSREVEITAEAQTISMPLTATEGCGFLVEGELPEWATNTSGNFGFGPSAVTIDVGANESEDARSFTFRIAGLEVRVTQKAAE